MKYRDLPSIEQAFQVAAHPDTKMYFSQCGEDVIVELLLGAFKMADRPGFYVDVGAFHPTQASNTRLLSLRGWRGVNIDGSAGTIALFKAQRPRDISVHAVVSDEPGEVEFNIYKQGTLNTADAATKALVAGRNQSELLETVRMATRTLRDILDEAVPPGQRVDVMNVDVEGFDLRVLRSNDWDRYAPMLLMVEDHALSLLDRPSSKIFQFLKPLGYRLVAHAFMTSIYVRDQPVAASATQPR